MNTQTHCVRHGDARLADNTKGADDPDLIRTSIFVYGRHDRAYKPLLRFLLSRERQARNAARATQNLRTFHFDPRGALIEARHAFGALR